MISRRIRILVPVVLVACAAGTWYWFHIQPKTILPAEIVVGNLEPAVVTLLRDKRNAVLHDPRSAQAWGELGKAYLANELEEESRSCFVQAEKLDATNPRWPYYQAITAINRGERESAIELLLRTVSRCEKSLVDETSPRLVLAETLLILGREDEADAQLRIALARDPENPRAMFDSALLALARQRWEKANAHLIQCLASPYAGKKARIQLAILNRRLDHSDTAEQFQREADRMQDDLFWLDPLVQEYAKLAVKKRSRFQQVDNLERTGNFPEAIEILRPMTQEFPKDYLPHLALGKVLAQVGEYPAAEHSLRLALQFAPEKVQTHYYLSVLLHKRAEAIPKSATGLAPQAKAFLEESVQLAKTALTIKPDYGHAHVSLGQALRLLGNTTEALNEFRKAVSCNPESWELHLELARMAAEQRLEQEAVEQYEAALRLGPKESPWREEAEKKIKAHRPPSPIEPKMR